MKFLGKGAALLVPVVVAFAINGYVSLYFAGYLFPRVVPRPYVEMMSTAPVGALAAALVVSWPLARLYAARAWLAALVVASPMVALRLGELTHYAGKNEPRIMVMSAFELFVYPALLVFGSWLVLRVRVRSASAA